MKSALPTAPAAYGLNGLSATVTVDNATPAGLHLSPWKICPNKRGQLSMEWFRNRTEAKVVIEQWRQHYNEIRPHSSLGNQTPATFKKQCLSTTKPGAIFQE